jgi:DNA helicase-2/ATP-dependent DNA helicase PcrA
VELLLRERAERVKAANEVPLPIRINASQFKDYLTDTSELAARMLRPTPEAPFKATRAGTVFHALMEQRFSSLTRQLSENAELDLADASEQLWQRQFEDTEFAEHEATIEELRANFEGSQWANAVAVFAEIEIQLAVDDNIFICKLDAVFQDAQGNYQVVDWKTGAAPTEAVDIEKRGLQLSLYRIAFATLMNLPLESVSACFYYVAENKVITPAHLLTVEELRQRWSEVVA